MEADEPDSESDAALEGTNAHHFAAGWLVSKRSALELEGNDEMYEAVKAYVEFVFECKQRYLFEGAQVELLVEQQLPLEDVTGERGAVGTADCVLLVRWPTKGTWVHIIDFKYGRGVEVDDATLQLPVYGLAALSKYGLLDDITKVLTTIVQPRLHSEFDTIEHTIEELLSIGATVRKSADIALQIVREAPAAAVDHLQVTEKGCRFCRAQHKCPALAKHVHETVYGETSDIESEEAQAPLDESTFVGSREDFARLLPVFMRRVPMIEAWCKAVRAKVEALLIDGKPVEGYKLVVGRAGPRRWANADAALPILMAHHVPRELAMTLPELRTPADLEKKLKKGYPSAWDSLQGLISQEPGKPSVAPVEDPRPPYAGASAEDIESYSADGLV
jgi:hypothetical protein